MSVCIHRTSITMPLSKAPQSLAATVLELKTRPPKKFSPNVVAHVYSKVHAAPQIADLLAADYFAVVWRFFHADVTNSHLELLLQIAAYELALARCSCVARMEQEPDKLGLLLARVLQSTMGHRDAQARLECSSLVFLAALVQHKPQLVQGHPLYEKWIAAALHHYTALDLAISSQHADVVECFLHFCILAAISADGVAQKLASICLPVYFYDPELNYRIQRLADLLSLVLYQRDSARFSKFQALLKQHNLALPTEIRFASLGLDVSWNTLEKALSKLTLDQLRLVASSLGYGGDSPSAICQLALGGRLQLERLVQLQHFSEVDIFDLFEPNPSVFYTPDIALPQCINASMPQSLAAKVSYNFLQSVNTHILSAFQRSSGDHDQILNCTSKYFSRIENISVSGSKARLQLTKPNFTSDLHAGDVLVLLELQKPNKFSAASRMIKYGVSAAQVARLTDAGESPAIVWAFDGFEDRFNAVVKLPSNLDLSESIGDYSDLPDVFTSDYHLENCSFTLERVNFEDVKNLEGVTAEDDLKFSFHNCTVALAPGKELLPEDRAKALLTMVSSRRLIIESDLCDPDLISTFLGTLHRNWPEQTCVVLLDNEATIELLQPNTPRTYKDVLSNFEAQKAFDRIGSLLQKVSDLSVKLGLEEYGFDVSLRNALMLYEAHVVPKWKAYLKQLSKGSPVSKYPFAEIESSDDRAESLRKVVDHYEELQQLFSDIQSYLPLDKVNRDKPMQWDYDQTKNLLARGAKFVICALNSPRLSRSFNNAIVSSETGLLAASKVNLLRLVLFEAVHLPAKTPRVSISAIAIPDTTVRNPGFTFSAQQVVVPDSSANVNVAEAQYCLAMYQYMRLLGYPHGRILIAYSSPYMKVLLEEMLRELKINIGELPQDSDKFAFGWPILQSTTELSPCDYLLVSLHGSTYRQLVNVSLGGKKGLYLVGAKTPLPFKIKSGEFQIQVGGYYGKPAAHDASCYVMEGPDHLAEYVVEMTKTRQKGLKLD